VQMDESNVERSRRVLQARVLWDRIAPVHGNYAVVGVRE